ncbi:4'-phosphopantetheinyl transferase family protein [Acetobacterium wieringae]|uniref:4'-phosphopantetheinyl transferase family protein n=1 Tax=Acetobacterium wieringae TaxID=52694 RepID=UPI002B21E340|nr:4'-phosphopantetheinyl transferase superfamily protein [Acetobacterium wieringae]MEA4805876.1 4'-phosphopantetheinyl transferase superfamily protein [Acetobacterium wieringae]
MAVYLFDQMEEFSDELFKRSLMLLPDERQQKATAYRQKLDQKLSILGYVLLNYGLKNEYGISEKLRFCYSAKGKPYLSDYPQIHFNLSHCKNGVICAIHTSDVGVDIETVAAYDGQLAEYVCNEQELKLINKSDNKALAFTKIWTKKESLMKKTGAGLRDDLKTIESIDSEAITLVDPDEAYVFSIAGMSLAELGLRTERFRA